MVGTDGTEKYFIFHPVEWLKQASKTSPLQKVFVFNWWIRKWKDLLGKMFNVYTNYNLSINYLSWWSKMLILVSYLSINWFPILSNQIKFVSCLNENLSLLIEDMFLLVLMLRKIFRLSHSWQERRAST